MISILEGDFRERLRDIADESVDLILADPPYGQTSLPWDKWVADWPSTVRRVLKPSGSMWCFGTLRMFMQHANQFSAWRHSHDVVWEKHNGAGFFNDKFRNVHELAAHFYKVDARWADVYKDVQRTADATARTVRRKAKPTHLTGARGPSYYVSEDGGPRLARSVMYVRSEHGRAEHPTQKPIDIVEPLLLYGCPLGGTVLDPFFGSGTVGVVAAKNGRHCIGIERNPDYLAVAKRRLGLELGVFA
jgi:site-specific DNA-methyltransferase (adenine-specific)